MARPTMHQAQNRGRANSEKIRASIRNSTTSRTQYNAGPRKIRAAPDWDPTDRTDGTDWVGRPAGGAGSVSDGYGAVEGFDGEGFAEGGGGDGAVKGVDVAFDADGGSGGGELRGGVEVGEGEA